MKINKSGDMGRRQLRGRLINNNVGPRHDEVASTTREI